MLDVCVIVDSLEVVFVCLLMRLEEEGFGDRYTGSRGGRGGTADRGVVQGARCQPSVSQSKAAEWRLRKSATVSASGSFSALPFLELNNAKTPQKRS